MTGAPPGESAPPAAVLPAEFSKSRSRYKDQSPTLGKKSSAATTSPETCSSLFSFRLISAEQGAALEEQGEQQEDEGAEKPKVRQ